MTKSPPERIRPGSPITHQKYIKKTTISLSSCFSPKLSILLLTTCAILFFLYQIQSLHSSSPAFPPSWSLIHTLSNSTCSQNSHQDPLLRSMTEKLRESVTFLPLKDLRYADKAHQGHTWFMSSMYDTHMEGEVQYQQFPSEDSKSRLLCLKGRDNHDGSWNYYALAWPDTLPVNATLMKGLTFVSYNHYNYENIWHGLSAMVPFVAWHARNNCALPSRWVLYHWGELRHRMGTWLRTLMEATFDRTPYIETFEGIEDNDEPVCFEKAVVMRHNEGGMSRDRRIEVYDIMRCKARVYCNVSKEEDHAEKGKTVIGMTLFMRTGPRSFKNETAVTEIFGRECAKVEGCRLMMAYSNNLTFCDQVKIMSLTDILISPHGAQLTNMFLMDKNSSVMEFFPKGWLKLAGVGQYVYHWIASWSGMIHEGAWRDPDGETCPYPDSDPRCMSIYKSGRIGFNETYFSEWARDVLNEVKARKLEAAPAQHSASAATIPNIGCGCS
ncbi:hypothetical protein HS088_TW18G00608 [Tripterygium wilfordii]|uniref:Glycosyltransferase 61 catalytic domain-containing protein n=1 Tax=Tripterygium wilfordii TaxID=458696 RepID=A0A7J7CCN2_TRIWF|nr:uncharacterized protein LOC119984872 [Tripterygium wilfordii]KAF5731921.1 hypothetical protein HS088_TW18G00608 [Tripterygium wilfordii]